MNTRTAPSRSSALPALFNPDLQDDAALVAGFVARVELLDFLVDELRQMPMQGTVQHRLIIGARGMGKTTLLRRIAIAIRQDAELAAKLIPLTFPEEQYNVKDLADFWLNTLDAIGDELERGGRQAEADALDATIAGLLGESLPRDTLARRARALLVERCAVLERRPVLLVDNIDFVFNRIDKSGRKLKNVDSSAYWELREALSRSDAPVLIGGSIRLGEPMIGYEKAFYDFFAVHRLDKLSFDEMLAILAHLGERHATPRVQRMLSGERARLRTLYDLTGGNVRTVLILFHLLAQGVDGDVREDLERMLDIVTPLYKARFEELAEQSQVVFHALAMRWNPSAAAEVAADSALDTRTVSAQLETLFREGLVEKTKLGRSRKTGYQVAERFFNLWLLMRTSRRMRHKLAYLTRFLESFYDAEERRSLGNPPLADHLSRYNEAEAAYRTALEIKPDNWGAREGMAILYLQTGKPEEALRAIDQETDSCLTNPVACGVIRTLVALQRENWFDARSEFEGLLQSFGERIPPEHWDDVLRILAWSIRFGSGEKMLKLMREKGIQERFWPLYSGFEAALADNADWLLDIAPEARLAARRIFEALQHQLGRTTAE